MSRPSAYSSPSHTQKLLGDQPRQIGNNNVDPASYRSPTILERESSGIQYDISKMFVPDTDWTMPDFSVDRVEEKEDIKLENNLLENNLDLKTTITEGIRDALGIRAPVMGFKPNKENRDLSRLVTLNKIPENKTWSREEIEYYNRKGKVDYKLKNVENKPLPIQFNPLLPPLDYISLAGTTILANKPGFIAYNV